MLPYDVCRCMDGTCQDRDRCLRWTERLKGGPTTPHAVTLREDGDPRCWFFLEAQADEDENMGNCQDMPVHQREIHNQVDRIHASTNALSEAVDNLIRRLEPILPREATADGCAETNSPVHTTTPLGSVLCGIASALETQVRRLEALEDIIGV